MKEQPLTLVQLAERFSDEDQARALLERLRWPDGIVCPKCGSEKGAYALKPKEGSAKPVRPGVYKCKACRKQFTVTVGTIFEDSHIPLSKWLMGIYLMCSSKKGISAYQLHRMLEVTPKTAWFMAHRIRFAMSQPPLVDKLSGIVEVDETYVGGKVTPSGRGPRRKAPVVALVERDGRSRAMVVDRVTGPTLRAAIRTHVDPAAHVMTDGHPGYRKLGYEHSVVDHSAGEYVRGLAGTQGVESYFSLLKRGVIGTFHHVSPEHLHRYVDEFDFRYNARKVSDSARTTMAIKGAEGKRLTYRPLVTGIE